MSEILPTFAAQNRLRYHGRGVRHRSAKPGTAVQICLVPPAQGRPMFRTPLFFCPAPALRKKNRGGYCRPGNFAYLCTRLRCRAHEDAENRQSGANPEQSRCRESKPRPRMMPLSLATGRRGAARTSRKTCLSRVHDHSRTLECGAMTAAGSMSQVRGQRSECFIFQSVSATDAIGK